ncbi:unnamed protein product [Durusdinium trenchii]|uniref:Plant heme peroxidase family profile domain-containing protein n=1 Tax=Durusdinium trenchii TaxID=1381693 RepID=A0ABP0I4E7_9DINO
MRAEVCVRAFLRGEGNRWEKAFQVEIASFCFKITERAKFSKKAVVIGGGLLGLEAAKAAYDLGLETTILEVAPHLMPVQLDLDAGKILQSKIEALGLKVKTGVKVLGVETGSDGLTGVKIEAEGQEETLEATLLIVGAGVRPRQELAEMSGLELGGRGGIKVDHRMRSATDEHVWAVGEIASFNGGMCYQLSAPGYTQAEILADHMTNPKAESKFADADLSTKLKLLGVDVASFGGSSDFWFKRQYSSSGEEIMSKVSKDEAAGVYKKLVFTPDGTKLLGGILVGDISAFAPLTAVSKRSDLGGVSPDELMAGQMPKVDDGGDGTNLGDDDHVCNCHSVPKKVIRDAIMKGAHTFEEIKKCTKAGTGCGTCIRNGPQPKLLAHTLNAKGVEAGVCKSLPFTHDDIEDLAKARQLKSYDELVSHLGYPSAAAESDKTALGGLLDRIGGKPKGEGLDHLGQLKALKEDLWKFVDKMNCNPILVRLAWHDAGTYDKSKTAFGERGGANGSIRFSPEISMGANNGLDKGVKYLEPFKADYPLVSYADLYQMAAAVSIEHAGGPKIDMKYGRKDASGPDDCPGRQSRGTADNAGLPDAEPGPDGAFGCGAKDAATHLRNIFYRMGFDDKGIVALSGAHTIGRAFKERSGTVKEGYGESSACPYTRSMPKGCPIRNDGGYGVGMPGGKSWTTKWLKFDNEYFQPSVYEEKDKDLLWLSSDRCLHQDEGFKQYFMLYKDDQAAFFRDFAEAYKQLSEQGVIQRARQVGVSANEESCATLVQNHLREVHQRALRALEDWSGPYVAEEGEYYYNLRLKVSTWHSPVAEWEQELLTRQTVLFWCLLGPGRVIRSQSDASGSDENEYTVGAMGSDFLSALRLPLNLVRRDSGTPPSTPSTTRSFHTARSVLSSRSQRSRMTTEDNERNSARGSPPSGSPREHHGWNSVVAESRELECHVDHSEELDLECGNNFNYNTAKGHSFPCNLLQQNCIMAVDGSYESLLELRVVGLDGEGFSLRLPDPKSGRDLFVLIRGRVPSKPGAQLSVYIGAEGLSLKKTLREQGIGSEETLSYMFLPTNLAQAMNLIQGFPVEDEFALDGIVELAGIEDTQTILWMNWPSTLLELTFGVNLPVGRQSPLRGWILQMTLHKVKLPGLRLIFPDEYNQSLKRIVWPNGLKELQIGQVEEGVDWPSGLKELTMGREFDHCLQKVNFPSNLEILGFSSEHSHSLEGVTWPKGLELNFLEHFEQELNHELPRSLEKELSFGFEGSSLENLSLPTSLQSLRCGIFTVSTTQMPLVNLDAGFDVVSDSEEEPAKPAAGAAGAAARPSLPR